MPTHSDRKHEFTRTEIKDAARQLMAELGTAGLSLRGIARRMELTAPAIYRYYPSLDDLITALIVDNFNDLADTLEAARASSAAAGQGTTEQILAVLMAYREWARQKPVDFQLIYGNPIPGYTAPPEITVPAVIRGFRVIVALMAEAITNGDLVPTPAYSDIPAPVLAAMEPVTRRDGYNVPVEAIYLATVGWPMIHGIIMLELFNHLQPMTGDVEVFYRTQVVNLLTSMGMKF
ncbi:MAG: TetR/AcrR family transcriptional regulator [Anaerolineaceae bacterium]